MLARNRDALTLRNRPTRPAQRTLTVEVVACLSLESHNRVFHNPECQLNQDLVTINNNMGLLALPRSQGTANQHRNLDTALFLNQEFQMVEALCSRPKRLSFSLLEIPMPDNLDLEGSHNNLLLMALNNPDTEPSRNSLLMDNNSQMWQRSQPEWRGCLFRWVRCRRKA